MQLTKTPLILRELVSWPVNLCLVNVDGDRNPHFMRMSVCWFHRVVVF